MTTLGGLWIAYSGTGARLLAHLDEFTWLKIFALSSSIIIWDYYIFQFKKRKKKNLGCDEYYVFVGEIIFSSHPQKFFVIKKYSNIKL